MEQAPTKIPDNLITAIITHLLLGWGFLFIVKTAVDHLNHNAYLGLIIAIIIILPFFWIAYDFARIYPNQNLITIFMKVYGNFCGKIIGVIQVVFLFSIMFFGLKFGQLMVYTYFFQRTPFFIVTGFFIVIVLYLALKGIQSIGRLAAFMLLPPLLVILVLELLGLQNVNLLNIRPVFEGSLKQFLVAGLDLTFVLIPITSIFMYLPFVKNQKNVPKIAFVSLGTVIPLFFLAILGPVATFSSTGTKKLSWALVEFFHIIDFPFFLLEQAGLFFLIAWYAFFYITIAHSLFMTGHNLNIIFPRVKRSWFTIIIAILIFAVSNYRLNVIYLEDFLHHYDWLIASSYFSMVLITWIVARLKLKYKK